MGGGVPRQGVSIECPWRPLPPSPSLKGRGRFVVRTHRTLARPLPPPGRGCRASHRARSFHRRSGHPARHAARRHPALAARARNDRRHRHRAGPCGRRRGGGAHRRRGPRAQRQPGGWREGADGVLADRRRPRALRRRAGRRRGRRRPLSGRGRARPDRAALRRAARGGRSVRGAGGRTRRCCTPACAATSPATGGSATAIPRRPSPQRRIASASRCAIRAMPVRRSKPTASSPSTIPARTLTMCWPISRARSACMP